jgi:hypothetical protein
MVRRIWKLIRGGFEAAGAIQLLISFGAAAVLAAFAAAILDLPVPMREFAFLGLGLLLLATSLAVYKTIMDKKAAGRGVTPDDQASRPDRTRRIGIDNRGGGKSISKRPTFSGDLDVAIDNREGGQSLDEDSVFR